MLRYVPLLLVLGMAAGETIVNTIKVNPGESQKFHSVNYPDDAPANLAQTWKISTEPGNVIKLQCEDIRLFEEKPCGAYAFTFSDGGSTEEICGTFFDFAYTSQGPELTVGLRTGAWDRGFVSCTASVAGETNPSQPEVPAATRPPVPDPKDPYSFLQVHHSEEVDSSEHGGPEGPKGTTCNCGWANKVSRRMFGGRETKVNEFPFIAGIGHRGSGRMFCGASVLTPWHAITAAHCTYKDTQPFELILAEHDVDSSHETKETQILPVKYMYEHPDYQPHTFLNDITIVVMAQEIQFNKFIGPVCLPNKPLVLDNEYIKIIGWGRTEHTGRYMSPILRKVDLKVLPKDVCHALRPGSIPEGSPTQTCVYGTGKSACSGDSGGPLVWVDPETNRYTLIGLVSYGGADCGTTTPRVSTDVTAYLSWIQKVIKGTRPGFATCSKVE